MTSFIQQSACAGRRPYGIAPDRLRSRPRLLSRLLEDRGALRLIVAPPGFGKKSLAFEYASVMFGFESVFWIQGSSPCFLRDLDAGTMVEEILRADEGASLVVIVDLPLLEGDRARAFASVAGRLANAGCEVIATTARGDVAVDLLGNCVVVEGGELLVMWEDIEADAGDATDRRPLSLSERIPALRWGAAKPIQVVHGASRTGLDAACELAMWAMAILERGTMDDLGALFGASAAQKIWRSLARRCPFLGISADDERFNAISVPLEDVRVHGRARLQYLAEACGFSDREDVVEVLAAQMMERGECRRAVRAVTLLSRRRAHGRWLVEKGWEALWGRAAAEVCELYESATRTHVDNRADVNAMMAWAWDQRRDRARAMLYAQRSLSSERCAGRSALAAALAAWDCGNAATRKSMEERLAACLAKGDGGKGATGDAADELRVVAEVVVAVGSGGDGLDVWAREAGDIESWGAGSRAHLERRLLGAAAALEALEASGSLSGGADASLAGRSELVRLAAFCHRALDELMARGCGLGFGALRAASALERAGVALDGIGVPRMSNAVASALFAAQVEQGAGRSAREPRGQAGFAAGEVDIASIAPGLPKANELAFGAAGPVIEPLRLKLFGTMKVALGQRDITGQFESRPKTRLLLALLALHRGRELGRDQIASMIWPAADRRTGAKSFYRAWGDLRNLLSQQGSCPYLIRSRYGCRLDPDLFESDLVEFEALVRCLMFGPGEEMAWERAIATIQGSFGSVLLPSESKNGTVCVFRDRLESELVDGLVAASRRLLSQGELQGALWFAREAFQRDAGREDAAAALMRAQMATDQRAAAVQTFFACRDRLARTLGLDPSLSLAALYQQLLEGKLARC